MEETFLFFDIECANNIKSEGYICSFGYVLCDKDFNIIEKKDIVMNPKVPFDESLLSPNGPCQLAYTKEYFLDQPDFTFYYDELKALLTAPNRTKIGFAVENDVDFMVCACKHFNMDYIYFDAYDSRSLANKINGIQNGLVSWMKFYNQDISSLTAHNSCDDALMTMFLVKNICKQQNISLNSLFENQNDYLRTVIDNIESKKLKLYRKYMTHQIYNLYGHRCLHAKSRRLKGKIHLALNSNRDLEQIYEINSVIYENGGILVKKIEPSCTFVMEDDRPHAEWMDMPRYSSVKFITLKNLFDTLGKEEPPFKPQSKDIPDLEEEFQCYMQS